MEGDTVGAAELGLCRGPHRIGLVGLPSLPDSGYVVDVNA
jgi:hypothetical protein